jgi:hypothetical protein
MIQFILGGDFQKQCEYVWNFCKHGMRDIDDDVPHDPSHADVLMFFACRCYRDVCGGVTLLMMVFTLRMALKYPDIAVAWAGKDILEFIDIYKVKHIDRQEFLEEHIAFAKKFGITLHSAIPA